MLARKGLLKEWRMRTEIRIMSFDVQGMGNSTRFAVWSFFFLKLDSSVLFNLIVQE